MKLLFIFLSLTVFSFFTCFSWEEIKSEDMVYKINENHTEMIIKNVKNSAPGMLNFSQTFPKLQQITLAGYRFDPWKLANDDLGIGFNPNLKIIKFDPFDPWVGTSDYEDYEDGGYDEDGVWRLLELADLPHLESLIYDSYFFTDHFFLKFPNLKNIFIWVPPLQFSPFLEDLLTFNNIEKVVIHTIESITHMNALFDFVDLELFDTLVKEKPNLNVDIYIFLDTFDYEIGDGEAIATNGINVLNSQFQGTNIHFHLISTGSY